MAWSRAVVALVGAWVAGRGFAGLPADYPSVPVHGVHGEVQMPLYGLGTWLYDGAKAGHALELAFGMGYRHVDTAQEYKNQKGIGAALQKIGLPREEYFVTSKISGGLNSTATVQAAEECLADLGLEYVDLMLIHFPAAWDGTSATPEARLQEWEALGSWAKYGKARAIGVSHYCRSHAEGLLRDSLYPIAVNQVQYHVGMGSSGGQATDDKAFFDNMGILYQSFSSLCGPCSPPDNTELINGALVSRIGAAHGKTGAQVALRWLVQQGIPVIPKSDSSAHLKENMELFDFGLTDSEMADLAAATSPAVAGAGPGDSGDCSIGLRGGIDDVLVV